MKTIKCVSHFKAVTNKTSANLGKKRPSLEWEFRTPEITDLQVMSEEEHAKVATILATALESYGRTMLLKAAEDWDFIPNDLPSSAISVTSYSAYLLTEVSRTRTVTKETLELTALWYQANCGLIGKTVESGLAGASVIRAKLSPIAGNIAALNVMAENMLSLLEKCLVSEDSEVLESTELVTPVIEWLVNAASEMIKEANIDVGSAL